MSTPSLLSYYQDNNFNPVPIVLDTTLDWQDHSAKRRNLYERHLRIPLALLQGRSVLEFGPNSGENALVLASMGANLTLVEPNEQIQPQIRSLFNKFGFEDYLVALPQTGIEQFESETRYDLVVAEGFLYTLPNRDELIQKIGNLLTPGGLAVISFNDRYGIWIELTRRMLLWRACQLAKIDDIHSEGSLKLAKQLYGEDYAKLNASRPFDAWWKDTLVNPLLTSPYLWSYLELIPLIEKIDCGFYSSSPKWSSIEHFGWYKNVLGRKDRHQRLLDNWAGVFPRILTGLRIPDGAIGPATSETIDSVADLITQISEYTTTLDASIELVSYPPLLDEYLSQGKDPNLSRFNSEMKQLYAAAKSSQPDDLIAAYQRSESVRNLWGAPYHYICFSKAHILELRG